MRLVTNIQAMFLDRGIQLHVFEKPAGSPAREEGDAVRRRAQLQVQVLVDPFCVVLETLSFRGSEQDRLLHACRFLSG